MATALSGHVQLRFHAKPWAWRDIVTAPGWLFWSVLGSALVFATGHALNWQGQ